jgi:hypothetical protein
MNFQFSILIFAIVLVLVGTLVLRYSVKSSIVSQKWPPYIANCPDYWIDTTGDGSACKSSAMNVSPEVGCFGVVNFNEMNTCQKFKRSNDCKIYWDGINYGNTSNTAKMCS